MKTDAVDWSWAPKWLAWWRHQWKHFPRYWPFVRRIHRSPVNSPHKGQWRGALMFSLICTRINGWVNNGETGDLRRYRAHYDVTVMGCTNLGRAEGADCTPHTKRSWQPDVVGCQYFALFIIMLFKEQLIFRNEKYKLFIKCLHYSTTFSCMWYCGDVRECIRVSASANKG